MKTIGIIGSRRRNNDEDRELLRQVFLKIYEEGDSIVSGGCGRGADRMAEIFAKEYNIPIKVHPAQWDKYGKSAGFIRNTYIAEDADIIIALLPKDAPKSNGTEDTIKKAEKMGKSIILVPEPVIDNFDPYSI